jgi:hypothetical protein
MTGYGTFFNAKCVQKQKWMNELILCDILNNNLGL